MNLMIYLALIKNLSYIKAIQVEALLNKNNPPKLIVEFFKEQKNIENISCFSNEGNKWRNSKINVTDNVLKVFFYEKFNFRRGRVNCTINDTDGWRFLGIQFSID